MKISQGARKAIMIGSLCSVSYLAVYFARNILSAVTPDMVTNSGFTKEYIGHVSSLYFVCYALGQLINGAIGDKIKARYMISVGLLMAGVSNFVFAQVVSTPTLAMIAYGCTGFFLSMIYGPMTKVVAENTEPIYATRCSLGYTFAGFFGSPAAGAVAAFLSWQSVFAVSSVMLVVMAIACFLVFYLFERKGMIQYGRYNRQKNEGKGGSIGLLLRYRIVKFVLISVITGIIRTAVTFWIPTYISEYLGFPPDKAAGIFTVVTFLISMTTFVAIFVYERLKRNMDLTILLMFSCCTVFFLLVFLVKQPIVNLALLVLAVIASNSAATMLYSRYCPGLRDTGMVSSVTGFLDAVSYLAAAVASSLFANAVNVLGGWGNMILVWAAIGFCGVLIALPYKGWYGPYAWMKDDTKQSESE
ncbi:MAG: MFS transporter [Clostridia bacterium]|nr:MFS transporter [Clostridia bacterium]